MEERKLDRVIRAHMLSLILRIVIFAGFSFLVFTQVFGVEVTESNDMFPAVRAGDVLVYNRMTPPVLQDVVVFRTPGGSKVGRVEAMSGSSVRTADDGQLVIGGRVQPVQKDNGLMYKTFVREGDASIAATLGKDEYFVLGDKRDTAEDSRTYGVIGKKDMKGKVFMILRRRAI